MDTFTTFFTNRTQKHTRILNYIEDIIKNLPLIARNLEHSGRVTVLVQYVDLTLMHSGGISILKKSSRYFECGIQHRLTPNLPVLHLG